MPLVSRIFKVLYFDILELVAIGIITIVEGVHCIVLHGFFLLCPLIKIVLEVRYDD
jgi:hypothetical protein